MAMVLQQKTLEQIKAFSRFYFNTLNKLFVFSLVEMMGHMFHVSRYLTSRHIYTGKEVYYKTIALGKILDFLGKKN